MSTSAAVKRKRAVAIAGVITMSVLLVIYFVATGARALALLQGGSPVGVLMGVAMVLLPLIGVWALMRELVFGWQSTRLVDLLDAEGLVPEEEIDVLPSGRPVREAAEAVFNKYEREVQEHPDSWQALARLGIMTDAIGRRKEARGVLGRAIRLEKRARQATDSIESSPKSNE